MADAPPHVVIVAGPNGAGKTTIAPYLVRDHFGVTEYVNADVIARGLSGFNSDRVAMQAGRIMLERLAELAAARIDFAFETTLAGRTLVSWIESVQKN